MDVNDRIFVAGHRGMVGSAVVRLLEKNTFRNLILRPHQELDLANTFAVKEFFRQERPEVVILAAAKVGGINANSRYKAEFLHENLVIQNNVIHEAYLARVRKFCFLASSCAYPRQCPQPMKEEYLLTGPLEPTNEGYAIAKIAGLKLIEYYRRQYGFPGITLMPCNLYGTSDSYDLDNSHVLSALVKKVVDAAEEGRPAVMVWGTGQARREFMHVDDASAAILFMLEHYNDSQFVNIGWGEDITIRELAHLIAELAGFKGEFVWDTSRPDGMPGKCMDVSRMRALGFVPRIQLREGISRTIAEYRALRRQGPEA